MTLNEFMPKLETLFCTCSPCVHIRLGKKQIGHTYRGKRMWEAVKWLAEVGSCKIKHFIQPQENETNG